MKVELVFKAVADSVEDLEDMDMVLVSRQLQDPKRSFGIVTIVLGLDLGLDKWVLYWSWSGDKSL